MPYCFEGRWYPRFRDLFYARFDEPLSRLPSPPVLDGLPGRAVPPLGYLEAYEGESRRFVPDPERAELIAKAFDRVAGGTRFQEVWRAAMTGGLAGRSGCRISASGLLHVLRNPAYIGLLRYGQELWTGGLEPLVSEMAFKAAITELNSQAAWFHEENANRYELKHWQIQRARELEGMLCDKP